MRGRSFSATATPDSSETYQGAGRGLGPDRILAMHQAVCHGFQPDLTILLLPPLAACLFRARRRNDRNQQQTGASEGRFEREGDDFYTRIYDQYKIIAAREPQRVALLDHEAPIPVIADQILRIVRTRLANATAPHP